MFRIQRRVPINNHVRLNFSKSTPSITVGVPGARLTIGTRALRAVLGISGTGLFWNWWLFRRNGRWVISKKPPHIEKSKLRLFNDTAKGTRGGHK